MSLLEVARQFENHHLNLLVFDEPRQQSADPVSFQALFSRAGAAATADQQVVFATSEPDATLQRMLLGVPHTYLPFVGKMIKRLDHPDSA
jgi:hypothetical protein